MYLVFSFLLSSVVLSYGSFFEEVLDTANCLGACTNVTCQDACTQPTSMFDGVSPMINDDAAANVTLHCTGANLMMIKHNPGIFVIEQGNSDDTWKMMKMVRAVVPILQPRSFCPDRLEENPPSRADTQCKYIRDNCILCSQRGLPVRSSLSRSFLPIKSFLSKKKLLNLQNKGSFASFTNLTAGTRYRYRLHRLTNQGLSRPEISDWFSTYEANYKPLPVKSINLLKIEPDEGNAYELRAGIAFEPADDHSCVYNVLSWTGEHSLDYFGLRMVQDYQFKLRHLDFNQNNSVSISASNGSNRTSSPISITFVTPFCGEVYNNLSICAPEQVKGLQAEHRHREGDFYDVFITWNKPVREPYNYVILLDNEITQHELSTPGNVTEVAIPNMELGPWYEVSIVAESSGGTSFVSSIRKTVNNEHAKQYKFYQEITIGSSALAMVMILVGMICLQHYRRRNKHLTVEYTHFASFDQKNSTMSNVKEQLEPDYAVESTEAPLLRDKFEIYPKLLKVKEVLGSGAYGVVRLGSLEDEFGNCTDVAVKMLKDNPNPEDIKNFHQEIVMMKSARQHPNIVSLIGCCTLYNKPLLVVEYCSKGDLQSYLRSIWQNMVNIAFDHRARIRGEAESITANGIDYLSNTSGRNEPSYQNVRMIANHLYDIQQDVMQSTENITANDLLNFARQVSIGMEFLSSNRIIHRDLAARNVLVCTDKVVKISDFGLSRDIYEENLYRKQGNGKLPLKWMAIEALTHQIYTTHSDVWSFGILLWEIVTMGAVPYPGIPTDRILKLLKSGYRMERPSNCSVELYNVMLSCWNPRPQRRPTFTELKDQLDKLLSTLSENKYLSVKDILQDSGD